MLIARVIVLFVLLAVFSVLGAWLAESPGIVEIEWRGWRIDTSVGMLLLGIAIVATVTALVYYIWRMMRGVPRRVGIVRAERKRQQGYMALSRGMMALAEGDADEARRWAKRANDILKRPPGALLIAAQAALQEGDTKGARKFFEAMLEKPDAELLGVRGLLALADQERNHDDAQRLVDRALALNPASSWALLRAFDLHVAAGRWDEAEKFLREAVNRKALPAPAGKRRNAVLLVQKSFAAEQAQGKAAAIELIRRATSLAPGFLPATLRMAALLFADGQARKARGVIEDAWAQQPHPDLARLYAASSDARDAVHRLQFLERLEKLAPDHPETKLSLARAALDAKLWGEARRRLKLNGGTPTVRHCRLMAELEEREKNDAAAAREWLARSAEAAPDAGWVCAQCGALSREWSAKCGHCGAFDRMDWRAPPRVTAISGLQAEILPPQPAASAAPITGPAANAADSPSNVTALIPGTPRAPGAA